MSGYVKVFSKIIASSIWDQDPVTCKVWITMLASADKDGKVQGTARWLAIQSRVSMEDCLKALTLFMEPDPESTSKDYEGRRIESLEDGWLILNYLKYRDMLSPNEKDSASRDRVRAHRERYKALRNTSERYVTPGGVTEPAPAFASVSESVPKEGGLGETKKTYTPPSIEEVKIQCSKMGLTDRDADEFWHYWNNFDWKLNKGKGPRMKSLVSGLVTWRSNKRTYGPNKNQRSDCNKRNVGTCQTTANPEQSIQKRSIFAEMARAKDGAQLEIKGT